MGLAAITNIANYAQAEGSCQRASAEFIASAKQANSHTVNVSPDSNLHRVLFYGQADNIVDPAQASLGTTPAVQVDNAGHFDFIHPGTTAWAQWLAYVNAILSDYVHSEYVLSE